MGAQKTAATWSAQLLIVLCCACADDPTDPPTSLTIEPAAAELRVGSFQQLHARGADQAVTWSTSDTTIARVDANGVLRVAVSYTACGWVTPGECKVDVIARSGSLEARQTITIMPFEPIVQLASGNIDLEMGDSTQLRPRITLEGMEVSWCAVSFASRDSTVARVRPTSGVVLASDEGSTIIDVVLSGRVCPSTPVRVNVIVRPPLHTMAILPSENETVMAAGDTIRLSALVTNWKGVTYPALFLQWMSSNPEVASIEGGLVRAHSCDVPTGCRTIITARSGRLLARRVIVVR